MSEQENPSGGVTDRMSPVVVVESAGSRRSVPFKPTELQDPTGPDLHQKCAPAVTTAPVPENESPHISDSKDQKGSKYGMASDRHKHVAKKLSTNVSNVKRESMPAVAVPLESIELESKQSSTVTAVQPTSTIVTPIPATEKKRDISEDKADIDSITSDITELRSPETEKKPEWLDEGEPSGLPRSESRTSRTSRVTRAVRELFCCGVQLEAPSEDNMSSPREGFFRSGI